MPRALVFYHFFHPDDVVSARHLTDLATGLVQRGWEVTARPCNRSCRQEEKRYPRAQSALGITIRRVWRPNFRQSRPIGRLMNTLWMLSAWTLAAFRKNTPDVLIIGTDPILSVLVAIPWKLLHPRVVIAHWCFDLYPEAAFADGALKPSSAVARFLRPLLRSAYRCCDLLMDIGPCMRQRLAIYDSPATRLTVTPWALAEPAARLANDPGERAELFGSSQGLGLMYSGNFGRAHSCSELLRLARKLRSKPIHFAFSIRGNREQEFRSAVTSDDSNIRFVSFADETRLAARLSAADVHIVSLRHEWTGTVVPSKFFGALAAGRPVLFIGSRDSAVARWIEDFQVGWVLDSDNESQIIETLARLAGEPHLREQLFAHCHDVYQRHFSRSRVMDCLHASLTQLVTDRFLHPNHQHPAVPSPARHD